MFTLIVNEVRKEFKQNKKEVLIFFYPLILKINFNSLKTDSSKSIKNIKTCF